MKRIMYTIICSCIFASIAFATTYLASDLSFTPSNNDFKFNGETLDNVEDALNALYASRDVESVKVGTLTAINQSYTFENDGYIIGDINSQSSYSATIYFDERSEENIVIQSNPKSNTKFYQSIYVPKGTTVLTRKDYGKYNLELFEFVK